MRKAYLTSITSMSKVRSSPANGWLASSTTTLSFNFDDLHFHVAVIGGDLKHHAHFGLDVFGDFAHGHFHEEFFQMLPIRLIGGNGNRETVARVVSEQRILKTGDQLPSPMVNSRGSRSLEESNTSPSEKVPV